MSPDEDFVQIENPDEAMATRTVTSRERKEINESRNKEATEGTRLKKNETPQKPKKKNSPSMKSRKRMKKMTRMRSTMTIPEWKNHDAAGDHRCCFNRLCRDLFSRQGSRYFQFWCDVCTGDGGECDR